MIKTYIQDSLDVCFDFHKDGAFITEIFACHTHSSVKCRNCECISYCEWCSSNYIHYNFYCCYLCLGDLQKQLIDYKDSQVKKYIICFQILSEKTIKDIAWLIIYHYYQSYGLLKV